MRSSLFYLLIFCCISCTKKEVHPTVIIGGGLMGSSAAWELTNRGEPVLLLEQQGKKYTYGSSLGETRIARSLGPDGDIWGALHDETVTEVKELIDSYNNIPGVDPIAMENIYSTSPVTYVRHIKQQQRIDALMYEGQPDDYKYAGTPSEAKDIFGMEIPDTTIVIREYKPNSGTIDPSALIRFAHHAMINRGNSIRYQSKVEEVSRVDGIFKVTYQNLTDGKTHSIYANKVISAAGPWTGPLLKTVMPQMDTLLLPQRVFLAYLTIDPKIYGLLSSAEKERLQNSYPLINSSLGTRMGSNFSMIEGSKNNVPIIKIGGHFQRSEIPDLDNIWQQQLSDTELDWAKGRFHQYLNFLNLPIDRSAIDVHKSYSCVYTLTKNEVPYISYGRTPSGLQDANLIIMAGLSGVGGKGSLAYGRMAADLIQEVSPRSKMDEKIRDRMDIQRDI